jgi:DNA-binding NarL/FixJ family response regulator
MAAFDHVRVIVADDQLPFRAAAREVLDALPEFELVAEADSGEAAVSAAASFEPDLVLMDVHMEGIGGLEATRRILAARAQTDVILLSSYRAEDVGALVTESGALAFLPKDQFGAGKLRALWNSRTTRLPRTSKREPPSHDG